MCGCREHTDNFCTSLSFCCDPKLLLKKKSLRGIPWQFICCMVQQKKKKLSLKKNKIIKSHEKILEK